MLSTTACFVSKDDLGAALDADGDGVPLGEDCAPQDPAASEMVEWYSDVDGDGFGAGDVVTGCEGERPSTNTSETADDCDDSNPSAYPGAEERYYDGIDQDCAGEDADGNGSVDDYDQDADGAELDIDCDDTDPTLKPDDSLSEVFYDGIDNDCDLSTGDGDKDGDGYWSSNYTDKAAGSDLSPPTGFSGDCYDDPDDPEQTVSSHNGLPSPSPEAVYPGSDEEVPYDGVDSDCDGNEFEFDADMDGFASLAYPDRSGALGVDCQDCTDPCTAEAEWSSVVPSEDIYPGATETWYDGVDQDCVGTDVLGDGVEDDYDVDFDTFVATGYTDRYGNVGVDCLDTDDATYPGALDDWYDGIDRDCGGEDDFDADFDGYVPNEYLGLATLGLPSGTALLDPGDCIDDTTLDGSISGVGQDASDYNPAATDTWYDGFDHDCAGDDDYDKDADGHRNEDYGSFGPQPTFQQYTEVVSSSAADFDDCDDDDSSVSPSASEVPSNGIDDNCDGAAAPEGIAGVNVTYVHNSGAIYGHDGTALGTAVATGDLNGDGSPDIMVGNSGGYFGSDRVGTAYWFDGNDVLNQSIDDTMYAGSAYGIPNYSAFGYRSIIDDVSGDGYSDWIVAAPAAQDGLGMLGQVYVFHGAMTGTMSSPTDFDALSDSDVVVSSSDSYTYLGYAIGSMDETGDGTADLIVAEPLISSDSLGSYVGRVVAVDIASGGSEPFVQDFPAIYGDDSNDSLGQEGAFSAGDFDGDGTDELVLGSPGVNTYASQAGVVAIVEVPFVDGARLSDVSSHTIRPGASNSACGTSVAVGDLNLDGYDDVAFGCPSWGTDGLVGLQLGGASVSSVIALSSVPTQVKGSAPLGSESLGTSVLIADVTGDGQPDLIGGAPTFSSSSQSFAGRVFFVDGTSVASGVFDVANADGFVVGGTAGFGAGSALASVPDLDGDGDSELIVVGVGQNTSGGYGGAFLFTGGEW
jgi:hypothetical protein